MVFKGVMLQQWLVKNRLLLWWVCYIPLVAFILIANQRQLSFTVDDLSNLVISPLYRIFNSTDYYYSG